MAERFSLDDGSSGGGDSIGNIVDPVAIEEEGLGTGEPEGRRTKSGRVDGRTKAGRAASGRTGRKKKEESTLDLSSLKGLFVGLHAVIATATKNPELAIGEGEAEAFLAAAQNVARHYNVETTQKTLDIIAFVGITCGIYAPRAMIIMARKNTERQRAREEDNVWKLNQNVGRI